MGTNPLVLWSRSELVVVYLVSAVAVFPWNYQHAESTTILAKNDLGSKIIGSSPWLCRSHAPSRALPTGADDRDRSFGAGKGGGLAPGAQGGSGDARGHARGPRPKRGACTVAHSHVAGRKWRRSNGKVRRAVTNAAWTWLATLVSTRKEYKVWPGRLESLRAASRYFGAGETAILLSCDGTTRCFHDEPRSGWNVESSNVLLIPWDIFPAACSESRPPACRRSSCGGRDPKRIDTLITSWPKRYSAEPIPANPIK